MGNLVAVVRKGQQHGMNVHTKYATKLDFPRFDGDIVDDWIFKVDQFFTLDKVPEDSNIHVI